MRKPKSVQGLTDLGRVRLSTSLFMRDFLFSDIAAIHGLSNVPDDPDLAIATGTRLCEDLLEPLQAVFGRIAIRSAYRSAEVNGLGNAMMLTGKGGYNCASNADNAGGHIWDLKGAGGRTGVTACIVVPSFWDAFQAPGDWQKLAWWIHDHLPHSSLYFHPKFWAFNITWSDQPARRIGSYPVPIGILTKPGMANNTGSHEALWAGIIEAANGQRRRPGPFPQKAGDPALPANVSAARPQFANITGTANQRSIVATGVPIRSFDGLGGFPPPREIEEAAAKLNLSKREQAMLAAHLAAPNHVLSASELAEAAGFSSFSATNVAYGKLGHRLSDLLGLVPTEQNSGVPVWTYALAIDADAEERATVKGRARLRGTWRWQLRPELVAVFRAYLG